MKLGILGGGQLARMLTLAAYPLGIRTVCIDPIKNSCASDVTKVIHAEFTDESAIQSFLSDVDAVTLETENIPLSTVAHILKTHDFFPSEKALQISQDRFLEKSFFTSLAIPTATFRPVNSLDELHQVVSEVGYPCVLKTRRLGYDGKGQYVLKTTADIIKSWDFIQNQSLILESFVPFEYECSLIAVRDKQGHTLFYPLTLNHHIKGILHSSEAPLNNLALQKKAEQHARLLLNELQYVGVLSIEFFYDNHQLIANEMAPRVHNSGHWTIEGAQVSQFENQLRAIFGLPLGSTNAIGQSFLVNCIGNMLPIKDCLAMPGVHYHDYAKTPRAGRKVGHVTLVDSDNARYLISKEKLSQLRR